MQTSGLLITTVFGLLLTGCASVHTEPTPEARAALAPTGKLRIGLFTGNPLSVIRSPGSQEMKGVAFDLGEELARRIQVQFEPVVYPSFAAMYNDAKSGNWDVSVFVASPDRMKDFDFTGALVEVDLSYLARAGSPVSTFADVDRSGIRIAVAEKGPADVILSRLVKQAVLVRAPGLPAALEMLKSSKADAFAGNKATLFELSDQLPGSRVLDGRFSVERFAMAIPRGRDIGTLYVRKFVEDAKAQSLVKRALERAGARGALVAQPE